MKNKIDNSNSEIHFFIKILRVIVWGALVITSSLIFFKFIDIAINSTWECTTPKKIIEYFTRYKDLSSMIISTISMLVGYIAIRQYLNINTLSAIDFFNEKVVSAYQEIYKEINDNGNIVFSIQMEEYWNGASIKSTDFNCKRLNEIDSKLYDNLHLKIPPGSILNGKILTFKIQANAFAKKAATTLIDSNLLKSSCSETYLEIIYEMYAILSLYRSNDFEENKFNDILILFDNWSQEKIYTSETQKK